MAINTNSDKSILPDSEACYEAFASQEEIYRQEVEEELRAILIFSDEKLSENKANNDPCVVESPQEQLEHAVEDLITGDSDDSPLSEDAVAEMLRMSDIAKGVRSDA